MVLGCRDVVTLKAVEETSETGKIQPKSTKGKHSAKPKLQKEDDQDQQKNDSIKNQPKSKKGKDPAKPKAQKNDNTDAEVDEKELGCEEMATQNRQSSRVERKRRRSKKTKYEDDDEEQEKEMFEESMEKLPKA